MDSRDVQLNIFQKGGITASQASHIPRAHRHAPCNGYHERACGGAPLLSISTSPTPIKSLAKRPHTWSILNFKTVHYVHLAALECTTSKSHRLSHTFTSSSSSTISFARSWTSRALI